jgi:hypothetical protein
MAHKSGFETGPTAGAGLADVFERAERANSELRDAIESVQRLKIIDLQLKIGMAFDAIAPCRNLSGLTPSQREKVNVAYRVLRETVVGFEP